MDTSSLIAIIISVVSLTVSLDTMLQSSQDRKSNRQITLADLIERSGLNLDGLPKRIEELRSHWKGLLHARGMGMSGAMNATMERCDCLIERHNKLHARLEAYREQDWKSHDDQMIEATSLKAATDSLIADVDAEEQQRKENLTLLQQQQAQRFPNPFAPKP